MLSLHAVVWVVPGCCYQVMPKMTGKNVDSLLSLSFTHSPSFPSSFPPFLPPSLPLSLPHSLIPFLAPLTPPFSFSYFTKSHVHVAFFYKGNLKSLMCLESISDLSKLALSQDNDDVIWDDVIKPNIRHILAGILHGLAYLNSKGLQHCDLKGVYIYHVSIM